MKSLNPEHNSNFDLPLFLDKNRLKKKISSIENKTLNRKTEMHILQCKLTHLNRTIVELRLILDASQENKVVRI